MLSTTILLISGVLGVYRALKAQNPFTKFSALIVSVACLSLIIPHGLAGAYAPYFMAFTCFIAGFEPGNSRRLQNFHKAFFGISGVVFAFVAIDRVLVWPVNLQFWPLVLIFFGVLGWIVSKDPKKIRTRLGAIAVWCGLGLDHLLRLF